MPKVSNIIATTEALVGHPLNSDEGVKMGDASADVTRVLVTWMATRDSLLEAERIGAKLVIAHEALFHPYAVELTPGETRDWESWRTNRQRREVIDRAGITLLRIHGSADEICIFDDFAALLDLGQPVVADGACRKVYEIEPVAFRKLVERVKTATGMEHVRVSCTDADLDRHVHRVGLPWGGLGLFVNVSYQQWALEQGCDVLIAGEADNYGLRFSSECGVPMIETSHEISEHPGLRHFTDILAAKHPDVSFSFCELPSAWRRM